MNQHESNRIMSKQSNCVLKHVTYDPIYHSKIYRKFILCIF